ncbi:nucleoside monophosphate kinase [Rickettsiaceae bacterium]|nr:nucleoside monophosphate kinase [Rickettsiaceae bacterium]
MISNHIITLLGMPGSGKGTQGNILAKELGITHISTGDILREMASGSDTEESKLLSNYMNSGKLIPADLVNKIVKQFVDSLESRTSCVLDGYPRNIDQADFLSKNIDAKLTVIFFDIDRDVVVKRILGRISCPKCGTIYNKYFNKPLKDGLCDECVSISLVSRSDDTQDTILSRIEEYEKETFPLIEYYNKSDIRFFTVNANRSSDEVSQELIAVIKNV